MTFGQTIRALRQRRQLTQRELAKRVGVNFTYLSKIENDKVERPPSVKLTRDLAWELEADPRELVELSGHIDWRKIQQLAMENPDAARFLRALQEGQLSADQLRRVKAVLEGENDHGTTERETA